MRKEEGGMRKEEGGMRNEEGGMRNEEGGMRNEEEGMRNEEEGMRNEEGGKRSEGHPPPHPSPLIPRSFPGNEGAIRGFRDLLVWQRAMELAEEIYRVTVELPREERFGLTQQLRRAAVSVPSNIAEGHSRQSTGDYRHHLQMARGSAAEIQTQLLLVERLTLIPPGATMKAMELAEECTRMLATLIAKLRKKE